MPGISISPCQDESLPLDLPSRAEMAQRGAGNRPLSRRLVTRRNGVVCYRSTLASVAGVLRSAPGRRWPVAEADRCQLLESVCLLSCVLPLQRWLLTGGRGNVTHHPLALGPLYGLAHRPSCSRCPKASLSRPAADSQDSPCGPQVRIYSYFRSLFLALSVNGPRAPPGLCP